MSMFWKIRLGASDMPAVVIPEGYVTRTTSPDDITDYIDQLVGIWKYAALDLNVKNEGKKTSEEYIVTLIKMWDSLDKLSLATIENILVELDGMLMQATDVTYKIIRTQVTDYLKARLETGEAEV